jgi:hypothetical protein
MCKLIYIDCIFSQTIRINDFLEFVNVGQNNNKKKLGIHKYVTRKIYTCGAIEDQTHDLSYD